MVDLPFVRDDFQLKLQADWLRHSADGTFHAEHGIAVPVGGMPSAGAMSIFMMKGYWVWE